MIKFYDALPTGFKIFGFEIRFYAIFILIGAILAYVLSRYYNKKEGIDTQVLENTFYIAFPAGIIGARIWYVIAEWNSKFAHREFWHVFEIWEGGLAIQGGVIFGIAAGVAYVMLSKPHLNVVKMANLIIPNILLAQAIGRLGNFFNGEVYGYCIDKAKASSYLPNFIIEQMGTCIDPNTGRPACGAGEIPLPLFLIEGLINIAGFFVIMYVVRLLLKKWVKDGDLIGCYFIWYGTVRAILEPLRHEAYIMGGESLTSVWMSVAFIVIGIALIVLSHVFADKISGYYAKKEEAYNASKKTKEEVKEVVNEE